MTQQTRYTVPLLASWHHSLRWSRTAETRGDICESLMGYGYMVCGGHTRSNTTWTQANDISDIVDAFSWLTWRLHTKTDAAFLTWIKWIKDTAAWRRQPYKTRNWGEKDPSHQNLEDVCAQRVPWEGPRPKLLGFLCMCPPDID